MKYSRSHHSESDSAAHEVPTATSLSPSKKKAPSDPRRRMPPTAIQSFTQLEQQLETKLENARIVRRLRLQETISEACRIRS